MKVRAPRHGRDPLHRHTGSPAHRLTGTPADGCDDLRRPSHPPSPRRRRQGRRREDRWRGAGCGPRRGHKVLLCEVDGLARASQLLEAEPGPVGQAVMTPAGVAVMAVEGKAALAEYLVMIIPVKRLLQAVFKSPLYQ